MGSNFLKNTLSFVIFSLLVITLLAHDNDKMNAMAIENDQLHCSSIHRDFLKNKCNSNYYEIQRYKCLNQSHKRLQKECYENLKDIKKESLISLLSIFICLLELIFLWIISRSVFGGVYSNKLNIFIDKPLIGKFVLFYRNNQDHESGIWMNIFTSFTVAFMFFIMNYTLRNLFS